MSAGEEMTSESGTLTVTMEDTADNRVGSSEVKSQDMQIMDKNAVSFKTPSFVIPSKKKVQSTNTAGMFKVQDIGSQKVAAGIKNKPGPEIVNPDGKTISEQNQTVLVKKPETEINKENKEKNNDDSAVNAPVKKPVVLSPAEQLKQSQAAIPYKEPHWGAVCEDKFAFEVIKNGAVIDNVDLTKKSFYVVGRLPSCDIPMEHPSLSRHHAVVQYSNGKSEQYPKGWYLYDLDSTHGTWINKNKVPPQKYHRIHVDYVLKFGGSTRLFIMQGPDADREDESELSATEMKEQREKQKKEAELLRQAEEEEAERKAELIKQREESKGCSWGIDEEEAVEEEENAENPFAAIEPENEELYINDPKKSLNGYFEREGLDLPEYEFHEAGFGKWKCSVELPIDAPNGEPLVAEVVVSGKKKEAVIACALEACRILDKHGELRKSAKESRKRKEKNWEDDDFYDSDEDIYLDRTGAIEKKRELRKSKVGKVDRPAETYDSLLEKHKKIIFEIEEIEAKLTQAKAQAAAMESEEVDALDAYMSAIKSGMMDTKTKMKLKTQLLELKQEEQRIRKLVNIAKPASLPDIKPKPVTHETKKTGVLASVGKMKGPAQSKIAKKVVPALEHDVVDDKPDEIEEEEEEEVLEPKDTNAQNSDVQKNESESDCTKSSLSKIEIPSAKPVAKVKGPSLPDSANIEKVSAQLDSKTTSRMKGPSLPLAAVLEKLAEEAENEDEDIGDKCEEKVVKNTSKRKSKGEATARKKMKVGDGSYNEDDPDYAVWLPPENQSGDGKTHLNEKLGY